jgi:O-antigen/teichoic acid export membrane protein
VGIRSILKGGSQLVAGQIANQVSSFIRNLVIARLVSPADFGIAATFGMTLSLMEMLSNVAAEMLLVQSPDGNDPGLQQTAQLMRALRGTVNAVILLAIGGPMAHLFGVPNARWAFECLAIFPFAKGLSNLDMYRVQREMRFWPSIIVDTGSSLVVTIAALPLAFWLRSYAVMLWVLVMQSVFSAVASHLVAERSYGWKWNKENAARIMNFGWPLLINGVLLFGIFEGDRLVIGSANRLFHRSVFTLTDLGVYSVAFTIVMAPSILVSNINNSLFLPVLSKVQDDQVAFEREYSFSLQVISFLGVLITVPIVLGGDWAITFLYGNKYSGAGAFIGCLAVAWGVRAFRVAPTVAAIAKGDTRNAMYANVLRSLALIGMVVAAALGGELWWIALSGLVGELLALAATVIRLNHKGTVHLSVFYKPFAIFAGTLALTTGIADFGIPHMGVFAIAAASLMMLVICAFALLLAFPHLRDDARHLLLMRRTPDPDPAATAVAVMEEVV